MITMTFLAMVARHSALESWYLVIPDIEKYHGVSTTWLAACNSVYLFTYAIGNFISGHLEDRYPLRWLICGGLLLSTLMYAGLILLGHLEIYISWVFVIHWAIQGFAQSAVWPGVVAVIGNWFDKAGRGKIMGVWSSCASVGDIVGAQFGNLIFILNGSWMDVILPFAIFQIVVATIFFFTVMDSPQEQFPPEEHLMDRLDSRGGAEEVVEKKHKKGIPFGKAIMLPGVIAYSLNYACVKFLYYGLSMWLPYFLDKRINKKNLTGVLASLLDAGGVFGGIACGYIGDKMGFRSPIIVLFLFVSLPLLFLFELGTESIYWLYFIVIPSAGFCIAGASNIISSAVAADLAQNPDIDNKDEAMATVTGIVDGTGGFGAAIGVLVMGILSTVSWLSVFLFMIATGVLSIVCIWKIAWRDLQQFRQRRRAITAGGE